MKGSANASPITDAFREFHTDISDSYSGVNVVTASYHIFDAPHYRTGTCART
jgi:hypothetical protein